MISIVRGSILRQAKPSCQFSRTTELCSGLARLLSSLAVLEQKDGKLLHGSLGAVTAAKTLGGSITGFIAGSNIKSAAEEAARVQGVEKIIKVENVAYDKVSLPCSYLILSTL
jgi:electron transfer flavoprotein alpha subunit